MATLGILMLIPAGSCAVAAPLTIVEGGQPRTAVLPQSDAAAAHRGREPNIEFAPPTI